MNILVFSWRDIKHPLAGGAEQVDHEHHKGWIEGRHNVTLFSSYFEGAERKENIDGVNIIRMGNQMLGVHFAAFYWYFFVRHDRFDLVVDEFHGWPFFTPLYIKKPKLAVIQELTREVWFKYPLPFYLNYFLGFIGYLFEPLFFLPYRKVKFIVGSESTKRELRTVGIREKDTYIVPHGVIVEKVSSRIVKEKKKTIIFLGALANDKGIEDAIKSFGILNKLGEYQFWVVGKGDPKYLSDLKKLAKSIGLSKKITFFGFVTQNKKFELLTKAHVLINPSVREGWGLVNIEANVCGTPVVAYNSPGLTDSVKNKKTGIIVKTNSPEELASNVHKLLSQPKEYGKLRNGAISWGKKFSWSESRQASLKLVNSFVR